MRKFLVTIVILIGLLVAVAGLIYVFVPKETLLAKVRPDIGNFRVDGTSIGLQHTTIMVVADVTSNAVPVFVDSIAYEISVADNVIRKGSQRFAADSKKGKIQTLEIPVRLSHEEAGAIMHYRVKTGAPLTARIRAYCDLPIVGQKPFDFQKDLDIPLPSIPGLDFL